MGVCRCCPHSPGRIGAAPTGGFCFFCGLLTADLAGLIRSAGCSSLLALRFFSPLPAFLVGLGAPSPAVEVLRPAAFFADAASRAAIDLCERTTCRNKQPGPTCQHAQRMLVRMQTNLPGGAHTADMRPQYSTSHEGNANDKVHTRSTSSETIALKLSSAVAGRLRSFSSSRRHCFMVHVLRTLILTLSCRDMTAPFSLAMVPSSRGDIR